MPSVINEIQEKDWVVIRLAFSVIATVAVIGVFLNSLLFVTTIRSSNLRSTCNILIGCCSLFDVIHQIGSLIQFPLLFTDFFLDSAICSTIQLLPEICVSAGVFCVLSIGVDRMLAVLASPFRVKRKRLYLTFHFIAISVYCSYTVYLMVAFYIPQRVICSIPSPFHGRSVVLWNEAMTMANLLSVLVYTTTWMVIRKFGASLASRRLFRTICIVMSIDVAGWTITTLLLNVFLAFQMREAARFSLHYVAGIAVNSGVAFKAIVYYWMSTEYRNAFQNVWKIRTVAPSQTTIVDMRMREK